MTVTSNTEISRQLDLGVAVQQHVLNQQDFIGTRVAPVVPVDDQQGTYHAVTRESLMAEPDDDQIKTGDDGSTPLDTTSLEPFSYETEMYKLGELITDRKLRKLAKVFDYERTVTKKLANKLLLKHERRVASLLFNTTTFTGSGLFTDISSSAPFATSTSNVIGAIETAAEVIRLNTGIGLGDLTLVVNQVNLNRLLANDDLNERSLYITEATRANLIAGITKKIGLKGMLVAAGTRNTANKGQAFAGGYIWSSLYAMLVYLPDDPQDFTQPCIARTLLWNASTPDLFTVDQYRNSDREGYVYRVKTDVAEHMPDPYFGHLLKVA